MLLKCILPSTGFRAFRDSFAAYLPAGL